VDLPVFSSNTSTLDRFHKFDLITPRAFSLVDLVTFPFTFNPNIPNMEFLTIGPFSNFIFAFEQAQHFGSKVKQPLS